MHLLFARHAEPAWSVDGVSNNDPGLTPRGRKQAELLADRLAEQRGRFEELIVSSAQRAIETAEPIAATLGLEPHVIDELHEIRMPDWTGTPTEQVEQAFREAYRRPASEWWDGMPGGESFRDFHDRITTAIIDLLKERGVTPHGGHIEGHLWDAPEGDHRALIVAHSGTNACALGFLLGLEPTPWEWERFALGHASLARLDTFPLGGAHIFSMRSMNDMEHLPGDLRTR